MAATLFVQRLNRALVAATNADLERIEALPPGRMLKATLAEERTNTRHAYYFELCKRVADMLAAMGDDHATKERVDLRFRLATGHYDVVELPLKAQRALGVQYAVERRSISFEALDDEGMRQFVQRVVAFTLTELLPHIPAREFRRAVEDLLDEDARRRRREAA